MKTAISIERQVRKASAHSSGRSNTVSVARSAWLTMPVLISTCAAAALAQDVGLEEIVVTGSHIRTDTFSSSSPITVLDGDLIEKLAEPNVGNFLARVPSITSGANAASTALNNPMNTGLNTTSLRNLGSQRTLVLVNGRRFVSGVAPAVGYGVDLNAIPASIIERVEVLTGNQSAAYGSDAIAGVVNIITKTDFEGFKLDSQYGQTSESDGERYDLGLTFGRNFDDTGNAWLFLGYSESEGVMARDREYSEFSRTSVDTNGDRLLDTLMFEGSSFIPESRLLGRGVDILGDGAPFNGGRDRATSDRLNFYDYATLQLPLERKFGAGGLRLNLSEKSQATLEINYARVDSSTRFEPLPLMVVNGVFNVHKGGSSGMDLATHPLWAGSSAAQQFLNAGLTSLDQIATFRRVVEFGQLGASNTRSTFRAASAVDYDFDNGMRLGLSGIYGVTDQDQTNHGDINLERARLALDIEPDGNGGYRCADAIARLQGCVPYNPFNTIDSVAGRAGVTGFSPQAVDYLEANPGLKSTIEQLVAGAVLSGDLPFSIGALDSAAFAIGVEYREESGEVTPDGLRQKGLTSVITILPTEGEFDVTEAFGELRIPVLKQLNVDLAARVGDYSTVGSAASWKLGLDAPISQSFRLRAASSTAIRAPNISDLYAGRINIASNIFDPCNRVDATTSGAIAQNCRSIAAIQNRVATDGSFTLTQVESQASRVFTAGSPTVREEEAESFTIGAVLTPQVWPDFMLAADFYSIEIDDAIRIPSADTTLLRCYSAASGPFDPTCGGLVLRDVNAGPIIELETVSNNEEAIETSGVDIEAAYRLGSLGPGELQLGLSASVLTKFEITGLAGDVTDLKGEVLYPKYRGNLNVDYSIGDFSVFTQLRYRHKTVDRNMNTIHNEDLNSIPSAFYVDLRGSYQLGESVDVYIGATNLLDREPPIMGFSHKYLNSVATNGSAFEILGRQVYAGFSMRL